MGIVSSKEEGEKTKITGSNESTGLKGVAKQTRDYWQFSVNRLDESTTEEAVRRHLHQQGIEVKEIWMLKSQIKGTRTAKIRVAREHKERATSGKIWPLHCQVRDWDFSQSKKKRDGNNAPDS